MVLTQMQLKILISRQNVRYGGALEFNVDINKGQYLKVVVKKPSIVYRYVMMMSRDPRG